MAPSVFDELVVLVGIVQLEAVSSQLPIVEVLEAVHDGLPHGVHPRDR